MKLNARTAINKLPKLTLALSIAIALLFIRIFYPGLMSPDSETIYASAKSGVFSDHHPPMMAYLWRFYLNFHEGPLLMYLSIMLMLWGACITMVMLIFRNKPWRLACLFIPFIPQIAVYAGWVWKDNFFTYGYLFLSMWLAYKDVEHKRFKWFENIIFFTVLFYATSVKYQAKFILPILVFWYVSVQMPKAKLFKITSAIKSLSLVLLLCIAIIGGIKATNNFLVTKCGKGSNNAWKYKMIYDLTGASIYTNKILLPKFLYKKEDLTLKNLKDHYTFEWESLIVYEHSPLILPNSAEELIELDKAWKNMIFNYPLGYLKHRLHIWFDGLLLTSPGSGFLTNKAPDYTVTENKNFSNLFNSFTFLMKKFSWILYLFAYICVFPFQIYFLVYSFRTYKKTRDNYAKAIGFMSTMGLALLSILLFFSIASVPRYIHFTNVMFFFSIPFFFASYQSHKRI